MSPHAVWHYPRGLCVLPWHAWSQRPSPQALFVRREKAIAPRGAWLAAVFLFSLSGCATYFDHLGNANLRVAAGDYGGAISEMNNFLGVANDNELPQRWDGDRSLATLERATLQQAHAAFASSARDFSAAEQQLELLDLSTDPIGTLGSYLYSDSAKTYRTPPTERLALNAINLLNYLANHDLDGAAVEARRFQVMREYLDSLQITASEPATLGTYLAGFVFELHGEGDRALRYYDEALANGPLTSLAEPIRRLAQHNPYRGSRLSAVLAQSTKAPRTTPTGELLIVVGSGRVPHKEPQRMPVGAAIGLAGTYVTRDLNFLKYGATKVVVYPELVSSPSAIGEATVHVDGNRVPTEELADLGAAIRHEYTDIKPKILAAALSRMATRAALTEGVRAGARKKDDTLATILSLLFESALVALDRPDTRSWTTLPNRFLVARMPVAPGSHQVEVGLGAAGSRQVEVNVGDGGYAAVVVSEPR